jgi:hypothetical protein
MTKRPDTTQCTFISYIDRTREYYRALGYEEPYRWAHFDDVPFARLQGPLAGSRLTVVTTAEPWRGNGGTSAQGTRSVWSGPTDAPPERLYTDALAWDKDVTHTDDVGSFLPIAALQGLAASGRIGALAERFHGVPTDYSQRRTQERDAPEILGRCREDGADAALLVPL